MEQLQRALIVHAEWIAAGRPGGRGELLRRHPDLHELLEAMTSDPTEVERAIAAAPTERRELGDYVLLEELGRGGMGVVYRARQRSLDREVALKVLPSHVTLQPQAIARFRREATLAARLEHKNIVAIHAVGNEGGTHFFAMERIDGAPIDRFDPATGRPRSVRELVEIAAALCDALEHAHRLDVLHRDVKPSNILMRPDGTPALTDFGLARDTTWLGITPSGAYAGTPHYMAPEQIVDSSRVDARADVWGLAATLYELLTGRRAFAGDTMAAVFARITHTDPVDPMTLVPDLSPDLAAIVMKGLEKRPERRYASAAAFGADLRAFLEFRPITARPTTLPQRTLRWLHHHPAWRATLLALLAIVTLGPIVVTLAIAAQRDRAVLAEHAERDKAYKASLRAAVTAMQSGDSAQAERLLADCPTELRGFEWNHVARSLDTSMWTAHTDDAAITAVALDAQGTRLCTGSERGGIAVYATATGALQWRVPPPDGAAAIDRLAFAADGSVVVADLAGNLRRHDELRGDRCAQRPGPGRPNTVAFAPDLRAVLVSPETGTFVVLDPTTFAERSRHQLDPAGDRPQGPFLSDGTNVFGQPLAGGLATWNLATGTRVAIQPLVAQATGFATAGDLQVVTGFDDTSLVLWVRLGEAIERRINPGSRVVQCIATTRDGQLAIGCTSGEVLLYELEQERLLRVLHGHRTAVRSLATCDAGYVATGGQDGTVKLWSRHVDAALGEQDGTGFGVSISGRGFGRALAVVDDDLVTGGVDGTVRRVAVATETTVWQRQLPHWILAIAPVLDRTALAVTYQSAFVLLDKNTGALLGDSTDLHGFGYARRMVTDRAGRRVALLDRAGRVITIDVATRAITGPVDACTLSTGDNCGGLGFDDTRNSLWVAGHDGVVRELDATTLAERSRFPPGAPVTAIEPDGDDLLVATWDERGKVGDLTRHHLPHGEVAVRAALASPALAVAVLPAQLATARLDGRLGMHLRSDLTATVQLPQPATVLWNVVAHPSGDWLAIQCRDREPRVVHGSATLRSLTDAHQRARAAEARVAAARALAPTGWVPFAVQALEQRTDLDPAVRQAAFAALPPVTAWRFAVDSFGPALSPDVAPEQLQHRRTALLAVLDLPHDDHRFTAIACLALYDLRMGQPEAALRWLDDPAFAAGGRLHDMAIPHFVRACAHASLGDFAASAAALDTLVQNQANAPFDRGSDLVREAKSRLAAARR